MQIIIPKNIFTSIWALALPDDLKEKVKPSAASLIAKTLEENDDAVGLMPSFDLLTHKDLYISDRFALSFDGQLATSYLYFKPEQYNINEIRVKGDVTSNEVILGRLIFAEMTGGQPEMVIDTNPVEVEQYNYLIAGDDNFSPPLLNHNGLSFADQAAVLLDFPYVNYVLASKNPEMIKQLTAAFEELDKKIEDNISHYLELMGYNEDVIEFIAAHFNAVYYELTQNEVEGLNELLRLPYYKGMIDDIVELKFA